MADYKLNPPPPIEIDKADLRMLVMKLNTIHLQIQQVQRSLPYGPGNIVLKQRLSTVLESTLELISFIVSGYLE